MDKSNIGLIGLGVMGQNLVLNMADKGWTVSVWNRQEPGESESVASRFVRVRGFIFRWWYVQFRCYGPARVRPL